MSEPSEWALEKAQKVIEIDGIPDHAPLLQRLARAFDEAKALNTEKETMLLNQAKTIKEMQAENESLREALKPFTCKCEHTTECLWAPVDFNKCANRRARAAYEGEIK